MHGNYWQGILNQRLTRRRALAATGASALGAAFLAACGGDDGGGSSGPTGPADRSGLLAPIRDETSAAVPGGTFPYNHSNNVVTLDPHATFNAAAFGLIAPAYSTMVKYGKDTENFPGPDKITGDAMQSWETSPDGLRVTYKLRPNHKFDSRAPTNGRAMTVEDVRWSWQRVKAVSPVTADILREKSPTGTIDDFEFPDANTVVVKLVEPYGGLQETLAYWYLFIGPIEGEDKIDLKNEMRGSGPFRMERYQPSVDIDYVRNPDWYEKGQPFLDGFKTLFITEPAAQEAQFQAGNLWTTGADFLPETILRLKKDFPAVEMRAQSVYGAPGQYPLLFGKRFATDARMRRAASMLVDRQAMLEAAYGTKTYEDAGLDVKTYWDGHLANRAGEWVDPSTDELGEGAKFFKYDPAEAKKLFDAAGYKNEKLHLDFRAGFGPTGVLDILHGMLQSGGLNVEQTGERGERLAGPQSFGRSGLRRLLVVDRELLQRGGIPGHEIHHRWQGQGHAERDSRNHGLDPAHASRGGQREARGHGQADPEGPGDGDAGPAGREHPIGRGLSADATVAAELPLDRARLQPVGFVGPADDGLLVRQEQTDLARGLREGELITDA